MIALLAALWLHQPAVAGKLATPTHRAEWQWHTIETERFAIHFPTSRREPELGAEAAAGRIATVADALWLQMGGVLRWYPVERLQVVVVDDTDDLRAWAWPLRGTVVISAEPGTELGRGRSRGDQLVDVFAHELAHVFVHKRMGAFSEVASFGLDLTGHAERGGLSVGAALPFAPTVPQWWSEGGAEYLAARVGHGWWSPAREAGLAVSVYEDRLLDWSELQVAGDKGDSADGERAYQQGFAFFRWLEAEYGEESFGDLLEIASRRARPDPNRALRELTGQRPRDLYEFHRTELVETLAALREERAAAGPAQGRELLAWTPHWAPDDLDALDAWDGLRRRLREERRDTSGSWNLHPRWSGDGRWLGEHRAGWVRVRRTGPELWPAWDEEADDFSKTRVRRARLAGQEAWIPSRFGSAFAFVPGEDAVVVSGPSPLFGPSDGVDTTRLYRVDLSVDESVRARDRPERIRGLRSRAEAIPGSERGLDPAISPDGRQLAFVRSRSGHSELVVCALAACEPRVLTILPLGATVRGPSWAPSGDRLVVSAHVAHRNDLWLVALDGTWSRLTDDRWELADPWWAEDGIYAVADVDGVHDVFRMPSGGGPAERITRVEGMAATPSIGPGGALLYARRTGHGWKSMVLAREAFLAEPQGALVALEPAATALPEPAAQALPESRPYRVGRAMLPLAASPELRLIADPADAGALAGGWLLTRDPAEHFELSLHALVGGDALADAHLTIRLLPVELYTWAGWEDDRRWILGPAGEAIRTRIQTDAASVGARTEPLPDLLEVAVEGQRIGLASRLDERELLLRSHRLVAVTRLGTDEHLRTIGARGALAGFGGVLGDSGAGSWTRVEGEASAAARVGPLTADVALFGGWMTGDFTVHDRFRAGGDAPSALRAAVIEPARSVPGFASRSIGGSRLALGSAGLLLPVRDLRRRMGPLYLDDLGLRVGGDVGRAWDGADPGAPVFGDVVGEIRLSSVAGEQPWDSVVRVARGFGTPRPTGDPTDAIRGEGPVRLVIGLGTGW